MKEDVRKFLEADIIYSWSSTGGKSYFIKRGNVAETQGRRGTVTQGGG